MEDINSYTKPITIQVEATKETKQEEKKQEEQTKNFLSSFQRFSKGFNDSLRKSLEKFSPESWGTKVADKLTKGFSSLGNSLKTAIKNAFVSAWEELGNLKNYSTLSNPRTRELALGYGLSSAQAYGYDTALNMMGFSSFEDVISGSAVEKQKFYDAFTKYTEKYNELYDQGFFDKYTAFQADLADLKQELTLTLVEFMIDNKDLIVEGFNAFIEFAKFGIEALTWIVKLLGGESDKANLAESREIINSYAVNNSNSNRTTNVKIDNTFNDVGKQSSNELTSIGQIILAPLLESLD